MSLLWPDIQYLFTHDYNHTFSLPPSIVQQPTVTLPQLISFKTPSGSINVLEQIGTHYRKLGVLLLDDTTGKITKAIIERYQNDATNIIFEIFEKWIEGRGKQPVEWSTLVEVLKDIQLTELVKEMKQSLN